MKVLVLGATGYIGNGVARAFRRAGHQVYGLCRSAEKARLLARDEIHPVVGDAAKPDTWRDVASSCACIVSAVTFDEQLIKTIMASVEEIAKKRKLIFIHTSGVWALGNDDSTIKVELSSLNPPPIVAARPAIDEAILRNKHYYGIVLSPGVVYGRDGGSILGPMVFAAIKSGHVALPGSERTRWPMVHVDDLGEAYVAAAERGELIHGQSFLLVNAVTESLGDVLHSVCTAMNSNAKISFVPANNPFFDALSMTILVSSRKAETLLGWRPRQPGFADGAPIFTESWRASQ